jgi:phage shock protein A
MLNPTYMAADPAQRIENALARIEAAGAAKSYALERIEQRHAKLRGRIEDAVASLDTLIAREPADAD